MLSVPEQLAIIRRGAVEILVEAELEKKLEKSLAVRCASEDQGRF
jgi:hypothetical protein